jgi:hypothetical protein
VMVMGKGLVGYVDAPNGHRLILAAYVNMVPMHNMDEVGTVGETLAEIAGYAYQYAGSGKIETRKTTPGKPKKLQRH